MKRHPLILSVLALVSCGGSTKTVEPAAPELSAEQQAKLDALSAEVEASLNREVDPCVDFYEFACGGWFETYELPDDKTRYTKSFGQIADRNLEIQRDLLESYVADPGDELFKKQLGDYWKSCMDTDAIDAAGIAPAQPVFDRIDALASQAELMALLGELSVEGLDAFFGVYIDADDKNPNLNILIVTQGGTALPDRSFYLDESESRSAIRDQYLAHIATMFGFAGLSEQDAAQAASVVLRIETALAEIHLPRQDLRDPDKTYNKLDKSGLQELTPNLDWDAYLAGIGKPEATQINVMTPDMFTKLDSLVQSTDVADIRTYLKWLALHDFAPHLASDIADENFAFFAGVLYGYRSDRPRWKKCVSRIDGQMGELLGRAYVDVAFAGESKATALDMIHDIEDAFSDGLADLDWMDEMTAGRAVEKMKKIRNKIGYPDKWKDYSSVEIGDSYFDNFLAGRAFMVRDIIDRLEQPVDKDLWYMSPPTVNAYYNPTVNEIVFPAGIMQAPFYDAGNPIAFNYGAIGMVMGHELTHGFDDTGSKYDGDGKLADWWEADVIARFEEAGECVRDLYGTFEVQPDLYVNGSLTLGENIADLGGIKQTHRAYLKHIETHPNQPEIAGFNGEQQLFLAFAQGWCTESTPEQEAVMIETDTHAPARFRVNGPLMNLPVFGEAFSCEVGTPMRPEEVCEVW